MRSNNSRTASRKYAHAVQYLLARLEAEGFPIERKFTNPEDIADYFGGERIVCLRCGGTFKSLSAHIYKVHGWTADAYKDFYGLPWRTGLCGTASKAIRSELGKRSFEMGYGLAGMSPDNKRDAIALARVSKHRPVTPANITRAKRLLAVRQKEFTSADFEAVLEIMTARDQALKEVLASDDHPSMTVFYAQMRADPGLGKRYEETVERLSFAAQLRCQMTGERFSSECLRLRKEGKTVSEIALILNVNRMTVVAKTDGYEKPRKTHCKRGHLKEAGRSNCKVCNAAKRREERAMLKAAVVRPAYAAIGDAQMSELAPANELEVAQALVRLYRTQVRPPPDRGDR